MKTTFQIAISVAAAFVMTAAALDSTGQTSPVRREIIPGSELMTSQERERYRERMHAAKTPAEEQQVRADHLRRMRERARLHGLRLAEPNDMQQQTK